MSSYTGVDAFIQLLRIYTPIENKPFLKEIAPFALVAFLIVYACLLITDGYYFLVFLILGFSIGAFYSNNSAVSVDYSQLERSLSYKEQTLEQVRKRRRKKRRKKVNFAMQHKNNILISLVIA